MKKQLISVCLLALTVPALAEPAKSTSNSAIEAALKACAAQVKTDANGQPDRTAFDARMSAKGFEKPSALPSGSKPSGPPQQ